MQSSARSREFSFAAAMSQTRQELYSPAFLLNGFSVGCRAVCCQDRYSPISSGASKNRVCASSVWTGHTLWDANGPGITPWRPEVQDHCEGGGLEKEETATVLEIHRCETLQTDTTGSFLLSPVTLSISEYISNSNHIRYRHLHNQEATPAPASPLTGSHPAHWEPVSSVPMAASRGLERACHPHLLRGTNLGPDPPAQTSWWMEVVTSSSGETLQLMLS